MKTVLAVIGAIFLLFVFGLFALCNDDDDEPDSLGRGQPELAARLAPADHERSRCYEDECYDQGGGYGGYGSDYGHNRRDDRNRNRGAFSPGPFDDSPVDAFNGNTICLPGAYCDPRRDEQPPEERR